MKEILNATHGRAEIHFSNSDGKTGIKHLLTTPPFLVQKALYTDTDFAQMAHVYIMSSAGGILQGDRLEMNISAGRETLARVTTQAATKVYGMDSGHATQKISITLDSKSYLEFLPLQVIPYKSSKYIQDVKITIPDDAVLVYSEVISAGRVASGERFDMDACRLRLQAFDTAGRLLFTDIMNLEPKTDRHLTISSFGGREHLGTIYLMGGKIDAEFARQCVLGCGDGVITGISTLPNDCGFMIRALSNDSAKILSMIDTMALKTRNLVLKSCVLTGDQNPA